MNLLAIDTTTKVASVTIQRGTEILTNTIDNEITHSEKLLPLIDDCLKKSQLFLSEMNMLACINGPGSFTGVRIGLSTLKAFSQVYHHPIFSLSSLESIAYASYPKDSKDTQYIISMIDARNRRIYYQLNKIEYTSNGKIKISSLIEIQNEIIEDAISNLQKLILDQNISKENIIIAGNCVLLFSDLLSSISSNIKDLYPSTEVLADAIQNLDTLTPYLFDAYTLDATYARPSQAERMKKNE